MGAFLAGIAKLGFDGQACQGRLAASRATLHGRKGIFVLRLPFVFCLPLFAASWIAMAGENSSPPGEVQYQEAVAVLAKTDPQLADLMRSVQANQKAADFDQKMRELGEPFRLTERLLSESATAGHPVAQYRLVLLYQSYLVPGKEQQMCDLSASSLEAGFAPAALYLANACLSYTQGPRYEPALQGALAKLPDYARYYPQPTVWLTCGAPPTGVELQLGSANDFRAELYKLLASQIDKRKALPLRIEYLEKALASNGCPYARERLDIYRPAQ
ncbi:hypothetical protein [Pseudomonas trivialis]|uniref:hypothetical protein n=1 Tax=Pseudomonas trivialis TaxID=200450 RepID=UPI0011876527|nr:hypothetical protein [Pseudomonas trivialis]